MLPWIIPVISAGVSLFGNLIGSKTQANAQERATDAQVRAQREALALQERIYNQTRGDLSPWMRAGTSALSALTTLGGLADPMAGGAAGGTTSGSASGANAGATPLTALRTGANIGANPYGWPAKLGKYVPADDYGGAEQPTLAGLGGARGAAQGQSGYGMVVLRAPDGTTQAVPAQHAAHYLARGAQRVG